jgi:hypothetical protein
MWPEDPEDEYHNPNLHAEFPDEHLDAPFDPAEDAPFEIPVDSRQMLEARERFLTDYMNIPAGLSKDQIETNQVYLRDVEMFKRINNFLWRSLIKELIKDYNFGFESLVRRETFVSIYNKHHVFDVSDKLIANIISTLRTMQIIQRGVHFNAQMKRVLLNTKEVIEYDELKDYIIDFLQIDIFKNNFRGKFLLGLDMGLDFQVLPEHIPENFIYYISTGNHVLVLVYYHEQIVLFDPSYDEEREGEYMTYIKLLDFPHTEKMPIIVRLNVQNDSSGMTDLYCQAWCIHFLYFYIILGTDVETYIQMFRPSGRQVTPEIYIREIRLFILKLIEKTRSWQDTYYRQKYLKYKQKYLNLKKLKL